MVDTLVVLKVARMEYYSVVMWDSLERMMAGYWANLLVVEKVILSVD